MRSEPTAPDVIPEYIVTGIDRQGRETLEAIEKYARQRREYLETIEQRDLDEEDLAESDEELLDVEESGGGTVVIKKVPCGRDCGGCPPWTYKNVVPREGGGVNWGCKGPYQRE